ncbi:MAG TPA: NUDIX domain-containing protein [Candidatus Paceibacterota bacterium]|nr:NUDIX domain-containing protein [Candidatus Paceibacterota bacterium]
MDQQDSELLAVFNEKKEAVDPLSRSVVHREPLKHWHGVVQIWIIDSGCRLLCSKRSLSNEGNPGKWQTYFGGHVRAGDSFEETAMRETEEEIGITIPKEKLHFLFESKYEPGKHFSEAFVYIFDPKKDVLKFNDGEVSETKWLTFSAYRALEVKNPSEWCNPCNENVQKKIEELIEVAI